MTEDEKPSAKNLELIGPGVPKAFEEFGREKIAPFERVHESIFWQAERLKILDPGFCGIGKAETGELDPWWKRLCRPHDIAFNKLKSGDTSRSNESVAWEFTKNIGGGTLEGLKMIATGLFLVTSALPYWVVGGLIGGTLRYRYLQGKAGMFKDVKVDSND